MTLRTWALCLLMVAYLMLAATRFSATASQLVPEPALPGEWFVAKSEAEVMAAATDVLRQLGAKVDRRDVAAGVLVSKRTDYGAGWPAPVTLGLPVTQTPSAATLHIFVAPGFTPARLAVGAILESRTTFAPLAGRRGSGETRMYGERHLGAAIAERIAASLGTALVPMPYDVEARVREAARLGDAVAARCGVPAMATRESHPDARPPALVSRVRPVYPANEERQGVGGEVVVKAELTEHGTLTALTREAGAARPNLVAAATGAAGLWRFRVPALGACPSRRTIGIEMAFLMK